MDSSNWRGDAHGQRVVPKRRLSCTGCLRYKSRPWAYRISLKKTDVQMDHLSNELAHATNAIQAAGIGLTMSFKTEP